MSNATNILTPQCISRLAVTSEKETLFRTDGADTLLFTEYGKRYCGDFCTAVLGKAVALMLQMPLAFEVSGCGGVGYDALVRVG